LGLEGGVGTHHVTVLVAVNIGLLEVNLVVRLVWKLFANFLWVLIVNWVIEKVHWLW
jgi:hypothetical protein